MTIRWAPLGRCTLLMGAVALLAACGGSSSSAERAKLANNVDTQLTQANLPPDLASCVSGQARRLPIGELRELAVASSNPPPAAKQVALAVVTTCVQQGAGVSTFRRLLAAAVTSEMQHSLPAGYISCVASKAGAVSPTQLSQFVAAYATGGAPAASSMGQQLGIRLGEQCLSAPGMLAKLRARFIAPIEQQLKSSRFSSAFKNCFLGKARSISASQLTSFAAHPVTVDKLGAAWGKQAADACIASGAKP